LSDLIESHFGDLLDELWQFHDTLETNEAIFRMKQTDNIGKHLGYQQISCFVRETA